MIGEQQQQCDVCEQPWTVLFEWSYTDPERYCLAHILEPIEGQPGSTLLDYMPDCQQITHRLTQTSLGDPRTPGREVHYTATNALYPILLGRTGPYRPAQGSQP